MSVGLAADVLNPMTVAALSVHHQRDTFAASAEFAHVFSSLFHRVFFNGSLVIKSLDEPALVHVIRALMYIRNWGNYIYGPKPANWREPYRWAQRHPFLHHVSLHGIMILLEGFLGFAAYYLTAVQRSIYPASLTQNDVESHFGHQRCGDSGGVTKQSYSRKIGTKCMYTCVCVRAFGVYPCMTLCMYVYFVT
jgi:hypothetical protein